MRSVARSRSPVADQDVRNGQGLHCPADTDRQPYGTDVPHSAEVRNLIRLRNAIEELLRDSPDYRLLSTIPGVGPINALTIHERPA